MLLRKETTSLLYDQLDKKNRIKLTCR